MNNSKNKVETADALNELLKDLYKAECKKTTRCMLVIFILIGLLLISILFSFVLINELNSYEQVTITQTSTTETFENSVEGENANIVNGNQYNDSATHNENDNEE